MGGYASSEAKTEPGAKDISFHHNLLAHNAERGPLVKTAGLADVVNNVTYNSRWTFSNVDMENQLVKVLANYVSNYFKPGPSTGSGKYEINTIHAGSIGAGFYVKGNIGPHRSSDSLPETAVVEPGSLGYVVANRFPAPPITTTSAVTAYDQVLTESGNSKHINCDGDWVNRRDSIDVRIVNDVKNGTGRIIDDPSQVGGWITPASGTACTDSDHDGMADSWEQTHFGNLSRGSTNDSSSDYDGDGYTDLEEFLNGTNPKGVSLTPYSTPTPHSYLYIRSYKYPYSYFISYPSYYFSF